MGILGFTELSGDSVIHEGEEGEETSQTENSTESKPKPEDKGHGHRQRKEVPNRGMGPEEGEMSLKNE